MKRRTFLKWLGLAPAAAFVKLPEFPAAAEELPPVVVELTADTSKFKAAMDEAAWRMMRVRATLASNPTDTRLSIGTTEHGHVANLVIPAGELSASVRVNADYARKGPVKIYTKPGVVGHGASDVERFGPEIGGMMP